MRNKIFFVLSVLFSGVLHAQYVQPMTYPDYGFYRSLNIGAGKLKATNPSVYLELGDSTFSKKAFAPPRGFKDSVQTPLLGSYIFDIPSNSPWYYDGSAWQKFSSTVPYADSVWRTNNVLYWKKNGITYNLGTYATTDSLALKLNITDTTNKWQPKGNYLVSAGIAAATKTKITYSVTGQVVAGTNANTDDIQETDTALNKYFTPQRVWNSLSATSPLSFNAGTFSLTTVPISKGGTGMSSVGPAGSILKSNGTALIYDTNNNISKADTIFLAQKRDSAKYQYPIFRGTGANYNRVYLDGSAPFYNAIQIYGLDVKAGMPTADGQVFTYNASYHRAEWITPQTGVTADEGNTYWLLKSSNLSDVASVPTTRGNLGFSGSGYSKFSGTTISFIPSIPIADLAANTISGIQLGNNLNPLTNGFGVNTLSYNGNLAKVASVDSFSVLTRAMGKKPIDSLGVIIATKFNTSDTSLLQQKLSGLGFVKGDGSGHITYDNSSYQPLDADLTTIAALTATTNNFIVSVSSAWASRTPAQVKTILSLDLVENTALSTWAGTANITTLGTITTGTWHGIAIGTAYGGAPSGGASGYMLTKNSSTSYDYSWVAAPTGFSNPMTTLGDIMYEDATPTANRLAGNTTATKKFLSQTGNGTISAPPGWNVLVAGDIPDISGTYATASNTMTFTNKTFSGTTNNLGRVNMALGSDATSDMYYNSAGGQLTRLGIGSNGQFLWVTGGTPAWHNIVSTDIPALSNLTATDGTLTFSGTYNTTAARTIGLNLSNANAWTITQTFTDIQSNTYALTSSGYNAQTGTSYTLTASDNGKIVTCNNASAITLTIPASLPAGFACTVVQLGAGQVTFTASSTTLHNRQSFTKTAGQYALATIVYQSSNTYITGGDMQ